MDQKQHEYTAIALPKDLKREIRIMAAKQGVSLAEMCRQLVEKGLRYIAEHPEGVEA